MAKKEPDGYFTTYLNTIQEVPRLLQKFFSSILDSDIREIGPISSIASGLIEQSAKNNAKSAEDLLSTMLEVMNLYDGKLSEMTEILEKLESMHDHLSHRKSALYANGGQQLKCLRSAFAPKGYVRRHNSVPSQNPLPSNQRLSLPAQRSLRSVRRVIRQHHRPSSSQLAKKMSARRGVKSSGRDRTYKGVRNKVPPSVRTLRPRLANLNRRIQAALDRGAQRQRANTPTSPISSVSLSSSSDEYQKPRPSSKSNSTTSRTRKRGLANGSGERLYCICQNISFGEMIACDNTRCELEWFHFSCVDVKVQPEGQWFCPRCRDESSEAMRLDA